MEAETEDVGEADQKEEDEEAVEDEEGVLSIESNSVHHRIEARSATTHRPELRSDNLVFKISIIFVDYLLILHATYYEYNGNLYHIILTAQMQ